MSKEQSDASDNLWRLLPEVVALTFLFRLIGRGFSALARCVWRPKRS